MTSLRVNKSLDRDTMLSKEILVFDIETNGLLEQLDRIHCISIGVYGSGKKPIIYTGKHIETALEKLRDAEVIVAHNGIEFDIPAIQKVYPGWKPLGIVLDTLVLGRLVYPNIKEMDWALGDRCPVPKNVRHAHSLEAWGHRLGEHKGDYKKEMEEQGLDPWAEYNGRMGSYCIQDVVVNEKLLEKFIERGCFDNPLAWTMEMLFHTLMVKQSQHGFYLDVPGLQDLNDELVAKRDALLEQLQEDFPPIEPVCLGPYGNQKARAERLIVDNEDEVREGWHLDDRIRSYLEFQGIKFKWSKRVVFNPNSNLQVIERFKELGWIPERFTEKGQPKLDEDVLIQLGKRFPKGRNLVEFALLEKRISQISGGRNGWLKLVDENQRIHGRVNSMGCVSFRCSHSSPNTAQVPSTRVPYGKECREKWTVPDGKVLVGTDASGLELRMLAHYMGRYDGGRYAREVTEGDPHTSNQARAGLPNRDNAKTFIYGFIYGAGDAKLGSIAGKGRKFGKAMRAKFLKELPALDRVIKGVRATVAKHKKLKALDGRILYARSAHSALNLLLQSAGAILCKLATVLLWEELRDKGLKWGRDYAFVAHAHDEWQIEAEPDVAALIEKLGVESIERAGRMLNLRCPVTGEAKHGKSWAETH